MKWSLLLLTAFTLLALATGSGMLILACGVGALCLLAIRVDQQLSGAE